jgi:hypothetical protein
LVRRASNGRVSVGAAHDRAFAFATCSRSVHVSLLS